MTKVLQLPRPVMGCPTSLDTDQAWGEFCEEGQHLRAAKRLAHDDSALLVDTVNLKNILGQIEADRANFHGGWLLLLVFA
jgi:hypothetical protein